MDESEIVVNLLRSKFACVGYEFACEREVEGMLSKLNYHKLDDFTISSFVRDMKIDNIVNNNNKYIIDMNRFIVNDNGYLHHFPGASRAQAMRDLISKIHKINNVNIVCTAPIHRNISNAPLVETPLLYGSEFIVSYLKVNNEIVRKVIKSRFS